MIFNLINRCDIFLARLFFKKNCVRYVSDKRGNRNESLVNIAIEGTGRTSLLLEVVGVGKQGSPKCFTLEGVNHKYLFNCGEGTQRIFSEYIKRISKVGDIFITRNSFENTGGLLGLCLSLDHAYIDSLRIHGPPAVEKSIADVRYFSPFKRLRFVKHEIERKEFKDFEITVEYVPLYPSSEDWLQMSLPSSQSKSEDELSVSYIITPAPPKRFFSIEKCVDLGVERGPLLTELLNGRNVVLENGTAVKADDVFSTIPPLLPIIVVDCPTKDCMRALLGNERLASYHVTNDGAEPLVDLVVHLAPPSIVSTEEYQYWLDRFGPKTNHLILNEDGCEICHEKLYKHQACLNYVHAGMFPLLPHQRTPEKFVAKNSLKDNVVYGETGLQYVIKGRRRREFSRRHCLALKSAEEYYRECLETTSDEIDDTTSAENKKEQLKNLISESRQIRVEETNIFPRVVPLGTGSTTSNGGRNVSAYLVHLDEESAMLLDCGEGTLGQLYRHYGKEGVDRILRQLKGVFVSHLHADHHLGLIGLAKAREHLFKSMGHEVTPLILIVTPNIQDWLNLFSHTNYLFRIVNADEFYFPTPRQQTKLYHEIIRALNLRELRTVMVFHSGYPYGVVLTTQYGYKLVYSGDTKPCRHLVAAGQNCDMLIHEATLEDGKEDEAFSKKHSTISQAIDIGVQMKAKFTLLTHFSQRFHILPIFSEKLADIDNVGLAFDNIEITPRDRRILPRLTSAFKILFSEAYNAMEEKVKIRSHIFDDGDVENECATDNRDSNSRTMLSRKDVTTKR